MIIDQAKKLIGVGKITKVTEVTELSGAKYQTKGD